MNSFHSLLLVLAFWTYPAEPSSCHTSEWNTCLLPVTLNARGALMPKTNDSLASSCKIWRSFWKCSDNYLLKCVSDMHRMFMELGLQQPRENFFELCNPHSKVWADYENHLPCASDAITLTLQTCTDNFESLVHMVAGNNPDDRVNAFCCYFQRGYHCLKRNTEKLCKKGAFETVKHYLKFLHVNTMNSVCSSYDPESEVCKDYLNRTVAAPSESGSYLARLATTYLRFMQ